jgi:AhpD family alkylhydroperoxidase
MKSLTNSYLSASGTSTYRSKRAEPFKIYDQEIFLEPRLLELVRLRVAQICDCQLCIDHHTETLTAQGESRDRIEQLKLWRKSALYSERERVALEVGEALGSEPPKPLAKDVVCDARAHFNDAEILQLTLTIFAVNDWNHLCAH